MPRPAIPAISPAGQQVLAAYTRYVQEYQDLAAASRRNYLSDVRQFMAWYESQWPAQEEPGAFDPQRVTTATLTRYRDYLQSGQKLRATSVNRTLTSLKRFFSWAVDQQLVSGNPAEVVKWVPEDADAPPQMTDQQEDDLVAAVLAGGNLRDRTLITLMLHTGLRAGEVCGLRREQIVLQKRSGRVQVRGKRNKTREVPLNATARAVLAEYLRTLPAAATYLFCSERTGTALTERALGHLITTDRRIKILTSALADAARDDSWLLP